jgi:peroxiredoxin Q/BCP
MKTHIGKPAPQFSLVDQHGTQHALSAYRGKRVILYFYPKDMTGGCTLEAQGFEDIYARLKKAGIVLFGISPDSAASHQKFCDKEGLTFPLLVDENHMVADEYGVWVQKSMYGRTYMGIQRDTFIIAPDGTLEAHFEKVNPAKHPEEILEYMKLS